MIIKSDFVTLGADVMKYWEGSAAPSPTHKHNVTIPANCLNGHTRGTAASLISNRLSIVVAFIQVRSSANVLLCSFGFDTLHLTLSMTGKTQTAN